jgi:serine/threonine protein phosphatase 1
MFGSMRNLLRSGRSRGEAPRQTRVPDGSRVYAVGDIHGCLGLLEELHWLIRADAEMAGAGRNVVIYLGDLVDRGSDSAGVIDLLLDRPLQDFEAFHLRGNHEDMFLDFLDDPASGDQWLGNGGDATLASYGVAIAPGEKSLDAMCGELRENLPKRHLDFLRGLAYAHGEGDYWFVHAGVRPGVPLENQSPADMMWIRDRFLRSGEDYGKIVVHGHSPRETVEQYDNRIGVDTGAYYTGRLSCIALEGYERRVIHTGEP